MGAEYVGHSFEQSDERVLIDNVKKECHSAAHEYGHGPYSGNWGEKIGDSIHFPNKTFPDEYKAHDWLQDNCDKWGPLVAVKVVELPESLGKGLLTKIDKLKKKREELYVKFTSPIHSNRVGSFRAEILNRIKNGKSKTKGCSKCGSSIAVSQLKRLDCPVCGQEDFILTSTDNLKLEKGLAQVEDIKIKIASLEKEHEELVSAYISKNEHKLKWHWEVGAWCSS